MTPEQLESVYKHDDLTLEVIRESGNAKWLNRYIQNPETKEVMYFAVADNEHNITVHKGDETGPILATATICLVKDGQTDIHFLEPEETICLQHKHNLLPFFHGKTLFEKGGRKYHWSGHTALVDEASGAFLAGFHARFLESQGHKLGTLVVTKEGREILDLVAVSCLVIQERSDEGTRARESMRAAIVGRGGVMF